MSEKTDGNGDSEVRSQKSEDDRPTDNNVFRIDRLTLKNFRCFEEKTIDFHPRFNVLIGENGSGKTAVLGALAVALQPYVRFATGGSIMGTVATPQDVRLVMYESSGAVSAEPQRPCIMGAEAEFEGGAFAWEAEVRDDGRVSASCTSTPPVTERWAQLGEDVRAGKGVALPIVVYYRAERLWAWTERQDVEVLPPGSRLDGYANWAAPAVPLGDLFAWLRTSKLLALEENRDEPSLAALSDTIRAALGDATPIADLAWSVKFGQPLVHFANRTQLPFSYLSHGWATTVALIADLVRRCARLNRHFGADAARETPGVVLIDEIDLHLHPSWQRKVVDDLKRAFPKVQFIVTTHSPFIIQSLEANELINLDPGRSATPPSKSIEDIAEDVQGVMLPQLSQRRLDMLEAAEEYFSVLQAAKHADAEERGRLKARLDELALRFSDDMAYHAFLKMERLAAGLGDGDQ